MNTAERFIRFVRSAPTAFHAVHVLAGQLSAQGFTALREEETWALQPGGRYYVLRNDAALIAFTLPRDAWTHFQIVAAHGDSPMFKLKPVCEEAVCGHYVRLNTEAYGGMIQSSWLDRPLSAAGRLTVRQGNTLRTVLTDLGHDALLIPNLPIHFNREVNSGYAWDLKTDLLPLWGDEKAQGLLTRRLADAAGVQEEDVLAADVFVYNRMEGVLWGEGDGFFSSPRIDDLECAFCGAEAFADSQASGHVNVLAVFDNEEVGSGSRQGAAGTFLPDVLIRVACAAGKGEEARISAFTSSFLVSADNAHAVHPNHPEKFDRDNQTFMNGGVVIKHNARQKYTTDAVSDAVFSAVCEKAGVPVQHFANRSDLPGGSTLGNLANTQLSMNSVDIGLAQLAMHSSYETAGQKDADYMIDALKAFFQTNIVCGGGAIHLEDA